MKFRTPKSDAKHRGRVTRVHRDWTCAAHCTPHWKSRKRMGNARKRWLARDLRRMEAA
jgi:hypothetical protein